MTEAIVRPFQSGGVDPLPFHPTGQVGVPLAKIRVGQKGGSKTFGYSFSATTTNYMIRIHKENAAVSAENQG